MPWLRYPVAAMRVLITGAAGFVGRHLAAHLLARGEDQVWGLTRPEPSDRHLDPAVRTVPADLTDRARVTAAVREVRPEAVYHLAAQSSVARSLEDPLSTLINNIGGQVNLLESVAECGVDTRILVVGSSDEYGPTPPEQLPIDESCELRPVSAYAVSKVTQDLLGHQYFATHRMQIVRVRPFGHTGPGQVDTFVAAAFARQIAESEAGLRDAVIRVGYLDGERDFTDVRDVVRGYRLLLELGTAGEVYNLGSGQPRPIREVLDGLLAHATRHLEVQTDPALMRPSEVPIQYADYSKLHAATGWRPEIPFEQTLADLLEDWRHRVRAAT